MPTVEPSGQANNSACPGRGGWQAVVVLTVTATAVTVTAFLTHSAVLVGTVLRGR